MAESTEQPGYILTPEVAEKLKRMWVLNAALKSDECEELLSDDDVMDESRSLREELVPVFLPLVQQLVRAGLLTMDIEIDELNELNGLSSLAGEGFHAFDNGNIWIQCEFSSGTCRASGTA